MGTLRYISCFLLFFFVVNCATNEQNHLFLQTDTSYHLIGALTNEPGKLSLKKTKPQISANEYYKNYSNTLRLLLGGQFRFNGPWIGGLHSGKENGAASIGYTFSEQENSANALFLFVGGASGLAWANRFQLTPDLQLKSNVSIVQSNDSLSIAGYDSPIGAYSFKSTRLEIPIMLAPGSKKDNIEIWLIGLRYLQRLSAHDFSIKDFYGNLEKRNSNEVSTNNIFAPALSLELGLSKTF